MRINWPEVTHWPLEHFVVFARVQQRASCLPAGVPVVCLHNVCVSLCVPMESISSVGLN